MQTGWIYSVYTAIQRVQVGYHYTPYTQLYRGFRLDIIILHIHSHTEGSGWISLHSVYTAIQRVWVGYTPYTQLNRGFRYTAIQRVQVGYHYTPYIHSYTEGSGWIYSVYTATQRVQVGYTPYTQPYRGFRLDILRIQNYSVRFVFHQPSLYIDQC